PQSRPAARQGVHEGPAARAVRGLHRRPHSAAADVAGARAAAVPRPAADGREARRLEPDRQGHETPARMILERAGRLPARLTRTTAPAAPPPAPPRRWTEDLDDARLGADEWIARRLAIGRLYVDLPAARIESLRQRCPEQARATVAAAERLLRHEF